MQQWARPRYCAHSCTWQAKATRRKRNARANCKGYTKVIAFPGTIAHILNVTVIDTAGQEQYRALVRSFYRQVNVIICVIDSKDSTTLSDIKEHWLPEAKAQANANCVFVVALNKADIFHEAEEARKLGVKSLTRLANDDRASVQLHRSGVLLQLQQRRRKVIVLLTMSVVAVRQQRRPASNRQTPCSLFRSNANPS